MAKVRNRNYLGPGSRSGEKVLNKGLGLNEDRDNYFETRPLKLQKNDGAKKKLETNKNFWSQNLWLLDLTLELISKFLGDKPLVWATILKRKS